MRAVNGQANPLIQQAGRRTATISAGVTLPRLPPNGRGATARRASRSRRVASRSSRTAMRSENVDVLRVAHAPNLDAPAAPVKQGRE